MIRIVVVATTIVIALIFGGGSFMTQKSTFLDQVDPRLSPQQKIDEDFTILGMVRKSQDRVIPTPQQRIDADFETIELACRPDGRFTVCTGNDATVENKTR